MPESLEPGVAIMVNDMKVGEFSQAGDFVDAQSGDRMVRIIYLKNRTEPHKANLRDDYSRIQSVAFDEKRNTYLQEWLDEKIPGFYVMLDSEYRQCDLLQKWVKAADKK